MKRYIGLLLKGNKVKMIIAFIVMALASVISLYEPQLIRAWLFYFLKL